MAQRWSARQLIELVLDAGSFESWDSPVDTSGLSEDYCAELAAASLKAGTDESVLTGRGLVRGRPVVVVLNEFAFLAGSIGRTSANRIVEAIRRATALGLPVLASTASGGTRMQEGTPAFVRMMDISRAVMEHRSAGLPYLVHLRHPTTGGVYASWGSLGHVTVAEPGALVGFLGPKVFEALEGHSFPQGVQVAENLAAKGVIDAVVAAADLPDVVDRALAVLLDPPVPSVLARRTGRPDAGLSAWSAISATRADGRIGVRDLLRQAGDSIVRLSGTDTGERDASVLTVLARVDGEPCVLIGQDRSRQGSGSRMGPAALRQALRAMALAEELGLPLVTVIDTPGADLSVRAEEGAIAGEIARCLGAMARMKVPTVAVILGQGCGGGALALLAAKRVIATERAWLTPLPPEGASVIVHGDITHAAAMAEQQRVRAVDLLADGAVHRVVPEPVGDSVPELAAAVGAEIAHALRSLRRQPVSR
ncbi:acetyl-CoA carboxyl transferase [Nocardioides sp. dk4132]|uniref:carboxyl transferase domain-containing protein n=2 Tax=unclassified Nocardioides TaxID=2615069 RepID=UPI0012955A3F|nr:carboxyl transferase domain-containing protein [Nocardioides sp. dk884]MQW77590.1 acetyl-CoA carboxyl transferase [Nocardioides sp. dk4132]QGA06118.1 acetyl-CoA carboxyl transferase [Nocardioides sp. dk884]